MEYIEIIKSIMNDCHLSQDKFARIIGVNQTTVGQWLQAKKKFSVNMEKGIYWREMGELSGLKENQESSFCKIRQKS